MSGTNIADKRGGLKWDPIPIELVGPEWATVLAAIDAIVEIAEENDRSHTDSVKKLVAIRKKIERKTGIGR